MGRPSYPLVWAWRIFVNILSVAVVLFTLTRTHDRLELRVLVSLLGLIFVSIRGMSCAQHLNVVGLGQAIGSQFAFVITRLKEANLLNDPDIVALSTMTLEESRIGQRHFGRFFVDVCALTVITVICLYALLTTYP